MRRFKKLAVFFILMGITICLQAQNGTNSPYSLYGLGLLGDQSVGINKPMSGLGIGIRQTNAINTLNPASYSSVDSLTFLLDFGFTLQNGNFQEQGVKVNAKNASVDYIMMQYRLFRKVGMTIGFLPYSNVGYSFSNSNIVSNDEDGENTSNKLFSGEGGLRQLLVGFGWRPFDNFSLGANTSLLYGDISRSFDNTYSSSSTFSRSKKYDADVTALKLDFGVQKIIDAGNNKIVLGATFSPAENLNGDCTVSDVSTGSTSQSSDTINISNAFRIPDCFGIGLSLSGDKYTVGVDASYQMWSNARFFGESTGRDRLKISLGGMYHPEAGSKKLFRRCSYMAGVYYQQPYFSIDGKKGPSEYGVSAGLSLPISNVYNNKTKLNISGQFVRVEPAFGGTITENYLRINIGISFNERWFSKWQVE
jgi:hypothetical protein